MPDYTTNFNLEKPSANEYFDINIQNKNMDTIDTEIARKANSIQDGRMSKEDKQKLDAIEEGATNYQHPPTHPASMITEDSNRRFVTDEQIGNWDSKVERGDIDSLAGVGRTTETVKKNANDIGNLSVQIAEFISNEAEKGASIVGIHDKDGNFTENNVEGALKELFQSVSNGKIQLETAITDMKGTVSKQSYIATFQELDKGIRSISQEPTHGKIEYTIPGSYNFTVPEGISKATIIVVGGGGGSGSSGASNYWSGGAGGGGGCYINQVYVTPCSNVNVYVGAGGAGAIGGTEGMGVKGSDSYFGSYRAYGGNPGKHYRTGTGGMGGGPYGANGDPVSSITLYEKLSPAYSSGLKDSGYGKGGAGCPPQTNAAGNPGKDGCVIVMW